MQIDIVMWLHNTHLNLNQFSIFVVKNWIVCHSLVVIALMESIVSWGKPKSQLKFQEDCWPISSIKDKICKRISLKRPINP